MSLLFSVLKMAKVLSTYLWYMQGLVFESKSRDLCYPTKILANTGLNGLPLVMLSVCCLYMVLFEGSVSSY